LGFSPCKSFLAASLLLRSGLRQSGVDGAPRRDARRLTSNVTLRDITFHSDALNRDMQYRAILPARIPAGERLPVIYLLHGGGGTFRDWSNYSDVARFAERNVILIMPQGDNSYYTDSAERPQDRYEDYIVRDLIADVQSKFPAATDVSKRAAVGVSMGGFGAIKLALVHPELFAFAGGISSAIDVPSRPFSVKRPLQWRYHSSIFGPWGSRTRQNNDPFFLARSVDPAKTPYLFLTCGAQEGLLPSNRQFAALLGQRHFRYEFHTGPGGHNWEQWNGRLPILSESLFQQLETNIGTSGTSAPRAADQHPARAPRARN
jgi:putative tributyrin esterase